MGWQIRREEYWEGDDCLGRDEEKGRGMGEEEEDGRRVLGRGDDRRRTEEEKRKRSGWERGIEQKNMKRRV